MQTDQMAHTAALAEIAPSGNVSLDSLFSNINSIVQQPAALSFTGSSLVLTVGSTVVTTGPSGKKKGLPQLKSVDLGTLTGTIDFTNGTTVTGNVQATTIPTMSGNDYIRAGVEIRSDKSIYIMWGLPNASSALATAPAFSKGSMQCGEVLLQRNSGNTSFVTPTGASITQFGTGSGGSGSGSGVGGISYVDNFEGDIDASGWVTFNDGNSGLPVDGIGGTVNSNFTLTKTTTNPLRGSGSFLITKTGALDLRGHGVSTDLLTFDGIDKGRAIEISFEYENAGTYQSDIAVYVYDVTNSVLITPNGDNLVKPGKGKYVGSFLTVSSSAQYRLILWCRQTVQTAWTFKYDSVAVGPEQMKEALKRAVYQNAHNFSIGKTVGYNGSTWTLASGDATNGYLSVGYVIDVIDSNNFVILTEGHFHFPPGVTKPLGQYYLSGATDVGAGEATLNDRAAISIPLYVSYGGEGYFNPQYPRYLDEAGDSSFRPYRVNGTSIYLRGGAIKLSTGEEIVSSTGATEGPRVGVVLNAGLAPAVAGPRWIYIDRAVLSTFTLSGRTVYDATQDSDFVISTIPPAQQNAYRYVEVGHIYSDGSVWSLPYHTPSRVHNVATDINAMPELFQDTTINLALVGATGGVTTLNHNLTGMPNLVEIYFYDAVLAKEYALNAADHITNKTASAIEVSTLGLTFLTGDYVRIVALRIPTYNQNLIASSTQAEGGWFSSNAVTSFPHNLPGVDFLKAVAVLEYDVTAGKYRNIDSTALVLNWDAANVYLDWTGLLPTATLQYKVIIGGSPLPQAVLNYLGGYTKYVGFGPGSFSSLSAAIAASAPGDSILVGKSVTEAAGLNINVANVEIKFMPNCSITFSTANGLTISGNNVDIVGASWIFTTTAAAAISITGHDNSMTRNHITVNAGAVITDLFNLNSALRTYVETGVSNAGTITNPLTEVVNVPADTMYNDIMIRGV
jgi:hypothetical protein